MTPFPAKDAPEADHLPDIVYLVDVEEQRNVFVNKSIETVLLYSPDDISEMGANLFPSIIHPDDLPLVGAHYERLPELKDGHSAIVEYRVRRKDGVYLWYRSTDTIYKRKADGSPKLLLGSAYDITPHKEREQTIELLNRELAHRVQNLFALNLSLVRLARRRGGDLDTVLDDLELRIMALGAVQGRMRGEGRTRVRQLPELIDDMFSALAVRPNMSVQIDDIGINEAQLNSLGVILYELFVASTLRAPIEPIPDPLRIEATEQDGIVTLIWRDKTEGEPFTSKEGKHAMHIVRHAVSTIEGTLETTFSANDFTAILRFPSKTTPSADEALM